MARPREVKPAKSSSPRRRTTRPVSSVTKKVRMSEAEADRLSKVAKAAGKTESEILREGILLAEAQEKRRIATQKLIEMAIRDGPEPPKIYWEGK